jgi:hypothetical protein
MNALRIRVLLLPVTAVAAVAAATAPKAQADTGSLTTNEVQFLNAVSNAGVSWDNGDRAEVDMGWGFCADMMYGITSAEAVAARLHYHSAVGQGDDGITLSQAREMVGAAIVFLCPDSPGQIA